MRGACMLRWGLFEAGWRAEAGSMTVPVAPTGEYEGNMAESSAATAHGHPAGGSNGHPADGTKRDLLELIAGAGAAIFAGGIGWALIGSMNPAADVLAVSAVEIDLAPIAVGSGEARHDHAPQVGSIGEIHEAHGTDEVHEAHGADEAR